MVIFILPQALVPRKEDIKITIMYQNSKYRSFNSNFRGQKPRFNGGSFGGPRSRPMRGQSKLIGKDPSIFIKKATEDSQTQEYTPTHTFNDFDISDSLKSNISKRGYIMPTPIQDQAIKPILEGRD